MKRKKLIMIIAGAVFLVLIALVCAFTFMKKEKPILPEAYSVGEENVTALSAPKKAVCTSPEPNIFAYEGVENSGTLIEDYVAQLTGEESGFSVVDDDFVKNEVPDFAAAEGTVRVAKNAQTDNEVLSLQLQWSEGACTVTVNEEEGTVSEPKPKGEGMTQREVLDRVAGMSPRVFGLEGSSMAEYRTYITSGTVLVDDIPCMRLKVYENDERAGTNRFLGFYFLSGDGNHLYRLDQGTGTVTELKIS